MFSIIPYSGKYIIIQNSDKYIFKFFIAMMFVFQAGRKLTATCFDSAAVLTEKYPDAEEFVTSLLLRDTKILYGLFEGCWLSLYSIVILSIVHVNILLRDTKILYGLFGGCCLCNP